MEHSHRSKWFEELINDAVARTKRLLDLDDDYHVLFIQGGASLQFAMVPMNLAIAGRPVDYINTGTWPVKAIKEAKIQGKDVRIIASSADRNFSYITRNFKVDKDAAYLHFTSNNTIEGTQWAEFPDGKRRSPCKRYVFGLYEPPCGCQTIRPDIRRGTEEYRARGIGYGHYSQGHAGKDA